MIQLNNKYKSKITKNKIMILGWNYKEDILYEFENVGYDIMYAILTKECKSIDDIIIDIEKKYKDVNTDIIKEDIEKFYQELLKENIIYIGDNKIEKFSN